MKARISLLCVVLVGTTTLGREVQERKGRRPLTPALAKATSFLKAEIESWEKAHECFSCHNSGDAVRVLFEVSRRWDFDIEGYPQTRAFLADPASWKDNGVDGEFNDRRLAQIQFGAALAAGKRSGHIDVDARKLAIAFDGMRAHQDDGGSYMKDGPKSLGAPATYGSLLATVMARRSLSAAEYREGEVAAEIDAYLEGVEPVNVMEAAALLMWQHGEPIDQREKCLELIAKGQNRDDGWGPYVRSASEVFDTSLVLIAISECGALDEEWSERVRKGRAYLVSRQQDNGAWEETTRPFPYASYAQHISTTAWAVEALAVTPP